MCQYTLYSLQYKRYWAFAIQVWNEIFRMRETHWSCGRLSFSRILTKPHHRLAETNEFHLHHHHDPQSYFNHRSLFSCVNPHALVPPSSHFPPQWQQCRLPGNQQSLHQLLLHNIDVANVKRGMYRRYRRFFFLSTELSILWGYFSGVLLCVESLNITLVTYLLTTWRSTP